MTANAVQSTSWVRIGAGTNWSMVLLTLGISVGSALLLASPVAGLIVVVTGVNPGWLVTVLWIAPLGFILLGVPLVLFANRPASIDLQRGLFRVGWRTVSFDRIRHVYRLPGGKAADAVVLQIEIARGLDARLPLTSDALPNLTLNELETLLAVLEQANIEPKPGLPLHSPIANELGPRVGADLIADRISDSLMPLGRVAYSKPTVLLDLQRTIDLVRARDTASGVSGLPDLGDASRAATALGDGLTLATAAQPNTQILPMTTLPVVNDYGRGFWGSGGQTFCRQRDAVEEWLRTVQAPIAPRYLASTVAGWFIIVVAIVWPWLLIGMILGVVPLYLLPGGYEIYNSAVPVALWSIVFSFFLWPVQVWGGLVLIHRARIRRFVADRSAALSAHGRGHTVPETVTRFFGAPLPERSFGLNVYWFGLVMFLVALVGGLLLISLGYNTVGGPYEPEAWQTPLGLVFLLCAVPILIRTLRSQRHMTGELARARVEWQLLNGDV
jgi:hypothetical protein